MRKSISGFTIVELLIVIVVIGILASIVIVAYTGIQTQASNIKTVAAVNSWAAAIQLYRVDKGSFPPSATQNNSCLGSTSTYTNVGYGVFCWGTSYWDVDAGFLALMAPYIGNNPPEPDITHIGGGATNRRGAFYNSTSHYIRAMFSGVSTCPSSSAGPIEATGVYYDGIWCQYSLN